MVRITIDDQLKEKLLAADGVVEFCDAKGELLARMTPLPNQPADPSELFPELTPEEVERRLTDGRPGMTTAEVKQFLMQRRQAS